MNCGPLETWKDDDTLLTSGDDRAGMLVIVIFGVILSFYITPETCKYIWSG